jgi:arsenate reductase-like glutaredoxin family protein
MRERLHCADFVRRCIIEEIESMLDELGHPPLVEQIFQKGWKKANLEQLYNLFDLCVRTFASRAME